MCLGQLYRTSEIIMKVEFHFDFGSPNAYLSHLLIPQIEVRTGVNFEWVPVLLGGVFKATNNVSPAQSNQGIKNKSEYGQIEMKRFMAQHKIDQFNFNPFFPVNTLQIMRGAIYAKQNGFLKKYVDEIYRHMWCEPKKLDDADILTMAMTGSGLPATDIMQGIQNPAVKQELIDNTNRSVEMGSFGSPTFYVEKEIFFGKDKLRDVEDYILSAL